MSSSAYASLRLAREVAGSFDFLPVACFLAARSRALSR